MATPNLDLAIINRLTEESNPYEKCLVNTFDPRIFLKLEVVQHLELCH